MGHEDITRNKSVTKHQTLYDPTYEAPRGVKLPESERRMTAAGAEMGQKGRC